MKNYNLEGMSSYMEKNVVFCFTGTGNCLKVSKDISASLENCSIYRMCSDNFSMDITGYKRVGFVYPVYFLGLPLLVREFIETLAIPAHYDGYYFTIATYANNRGNAVKQVDAILRKHGKGLSYSANIKMGDNAIAFYGSNSNLKKLAVSYKRDMAEIIPIIIAQQISKIGYSFRLAEQYYNIMIPRMAKRDTGFRVLEICTQCGICAKVCPVNNIVADKGNPVFNHNCQQCMACIQLCPQKAIDYKGKCARRNRYKHPEISVDEIIKFNKSS
jgi:ferredoxin